MSILLLNWNKNRRYCIPIFWVDPVSDLAGRAFLVPCFMLLVETWPPSLKPVSLVNQHWLQTEGLALGPVCSAWLCSRFLAKSQGFSSHPRPEGSSYFFPSKRALFRVYIEFPCSCLWDWNVITNNFFSFSVSLRGKWCILGSTLIPSTG